MAGLISSIESFDEPFEQWSAYTERFDYFALANGIKDEAIVPTFLSHGYEDI